VKITSSIDLPCPIEEAWAVLTRWERQADWIADADRVDVVGEITSGVGVRVDVRTRLFQVPVFTERLEVVGWEPPRRLEIVHGRPVVGRGTWALDPADGATRFTWTEDVALEVPLVGSFAALLYAPLARTLMRRSQRGLRDVIIASGPPRD
jgi:carbon monoxide dehydrogenase subunit G